MQRRRRQLHCELHRSPIAEHGWFVTLTDAHGGETTGWIGKRNRVGFLGRRPVPRDLRRALRHVAHTLETAQKTHRFTWR
ncbi:hypothetical protein [Amycolatopsis sp.]|jgi:hypothetical protein|uniref:hypothetical protein n=1 Tax=Amycolatopsis sp. TaxID=37632 RepID=UPI002E0C9E06|nr:hypothetical protein [Amycolatopsis sp.]